MVYHILGPKGTFTELALKTYLKEEQTIIYHHKIEDVLRHIDELSFGVVPIENTIEGYLMPTLDELYIEKLKIIDEITLDIEFVAIYQHEFHKDHTLYVQFAAKNQCAKWIEHIGFKNIIYTESNVTSYEYFLKQKENSVAIIPKHMKHPYQSEKIHMSNAHNQTRFIIVSKKHQEIIKDHYKVLMVLSPKKDYPGLLYDMLGYFKDQEINLTSIISRPMKQVIGIYHFYISCEVSKAQYRYILDLEKQISDAYDLTILGCY